MPPPPPPAPAAPSVRGACPTGHRPFEAADGLLVRVRPPAGVLTVRQVTALARALDRADAGPVELTSRANLQVRAVAPERFPELLADLVAGGLVHPDAEVDGRRAVLAAPAAGADPTEVADTRPLVTAVLARLAAAGGPRLHPKAGVLVDGGGTVSLRGRAHDVCLGAARRRDTGAVVVEVRLGEALPAALPDSGRPTTTVAARAAVGMAAGEHPLVPHDGPAGGGDAHALVPAQPSADRPAWIVSPAAAARVALAALAVAGAHPDGPVRVADLVDAQAPDEVAAQVERQAGVALEPVDPALLDRAAPATGPPLGVHAQRRTGTAFVGAAPPLGRLDRSTLTALAEALGPDGGGQLRLTPWRSLLVPDVPAERAQALAAALADLGLVTNPGDPAPRVIACAGSAGCPAGLADTQADARRLIARRRDRQAATPETAAATRATPASPPSPDAPTAVPDAPATGATIHLTGCPKRCASRAVHAVTLLAVGGGRYDVLVADPAAPTGERLAARGVAPDHVLTGWEA